LGGRGRPGGRIAALGEENLEEDGPNGEDGLPGGVDVNIFEVEGRRVNIEKWSMRPAMANDVLILRVGVINNSGLFGIIKVLKALEKPWPALSMGDKRMRCSNDPRSRRCKNPFESGLTIAILVDVVVEEVQERIYYYKQGLTNPSDQTNKIT
jgi:hypothetical protein